MCPTIGSALRAGRLRRGLTLQDAAHKTRISSPRLRALEQDDFASFGNSVYARSFLKLYSEFLQIDASQTLEWLHFNPPQPRQRRAAKNGAAVTADLTPAFHAGYGLWNGGEKEEGRKGVPERAPSPVPAVMATFVMLLGTVGFWLNSLTQDWQRREVQAVQPVLQQAENTFAYDFRLRPPGPKEPKQLVANAAPDRPARAARTN